MGMPNLILISKKFDDRIDRIDDVDILFSEVCKVYNLGRLINSDQVKIGYEDFNSIIDTENGKYFVKIFSNFRDDKEVDEVIERQLVATEAGISTPKIFRNNNNEIITTINIGDSKFRLIVTGYVNGKDFCSSGDDPTNNDLLQIVEIAANLQKINYKPPFIYDSWAISSFVQEFEKKRGLLSGDHLKLLKPIYEEFKKFDYEKLPKGYTHGDMIVTNLIKDDKGKIWLVDYSVANYTARLNEIAVICCDPAVILGDKNSTKLRIKKTFQMWCDSVNATDFEKENFQLLLDVANAIHVMNSSIEKQNGNDSKENEYFLDSGLFGLSMI